MTSENTNPFFIIIPGASQSPSQYGYISHLLLQEGYPVYSALLPSVGVPDVTVEEDMKYIQDKMILPVLEHEGRDAILVMHSYSSVPGAAAGKGLSKAERMSQGKKTGVIGQIYFSAILSEGSADAEGRPNGLSVVDLFGGSYPPHITPDEDARMLRCYDRVKPLFHDAGNRGAKLQEAVAISAMAQGTKSFNSASPPASWKDEHYKGRIAYIMTLDDHCIPIEIQKNMIEGSGVEWLVKELNSSHSPQVSQPENVRDLFLELAKVFVEKGSS